MRYNLPNSAGGFLGYAVGHKLVEQFLGSVGSVIVISIIYVIALIVITGIHPFQFLAILRKSIANLITHLIVSLRERGPLFEGINLPSFRRAEPELTSRARVRAERAAASESKREAKPARAVATADGVPPLQGDLFKDVPPAAPAPEPRIIDSSQSARKKLTPE